MEIGSADARRRAAPRLWNTDWLVLRGLQARLQARLEALVTPGGTVVDFGCGSMPYRALVTARGARYIGADFDAAADVTIAEDGRLALPDGTASIVMSVQVLEHVRDLDLYLGECARLLRPGGQLLLSTHGNWLYHPHPEDHRRWTRTGLMLDIAQRGFDVEALDGLVGPLGTTLVMRLTAFAFVLRKVPLIGAPVAALLAILMNSRAWLEEKCTPEQIRRDNSCVYVVQCRKRG